MWLSKVKESQAYKLDYLKTHSAFFRLIQCWRLKVAKKKKKVCIRVSYTCTYRENFMEMWVFRNKAVCGITIVIYSHLEVLFPKEIYFLYTYKPRTC